jgi:hypothetical protein
MESLTKYASLHLRVSHSKGRKCTCTNAGMVARKVKPVVRQSCPSRARSGSSVAYHSSTPFLHDTLTPNLQNNNIQQPRALCDPSIHFARHFHNHRSSSLAYMLLQATFSRPRNEAHFNPGTKSSNLQASLTLADALPDKTSSQ